MKALKLFLKLALVAGLFYLLAKKGFISLERTKNAFTHPDLVLPAFAMLLSTSVIAAFRWRWLLQAQGIDLTIPKTLQLTFIGNFFNIALPGAVSGDFVKAYYVAAEVPGKRAKAFGAILFDRLAGLSALGLVSATALLMDISDLMGTPVFKGLKVMIVSSALIVVAFYAYLFMVREHHDPLLRAFKALEAKIKKAGALTRIYESLRHYHHHRATVLKVLAVSVVIHLMVGTACILFAHALGEPMIPKFPVFVVVPLGLLVTAVPIMPAGVGVGHAAFGWLFDLMGSKTGADVYSLFAISQLLGGAIGGLVYLRFKGRAPVLVADTIKT